MYFASCAWWYYLLERLLFFFAETLSFFLPREYYLVQFSEDSVLSCEIILRCRRYTQPSEAAAMSLNTQFLQWATGILVEQSFLCRYCVIPAAVLTFHSIRGSITVQSCPFFATQISGTNVHFSNARFQYMCPKQNCYIYHLQLYSLYSTLILKVSICDCNS